MTFRTLKKSLIGGSGLCLLDIHKPCHLYVDQRKGIVKGVLTQILGPWKRPVAYLSKKLELVDQGWPACLYIIATTALLVKDAVKITMGGIIVPITATAIPMNPSIL